jgi:hypothetical protein
VLEQQVTSGDDPEDVFAGDMNGKVAVFVPNHDERVLLRAVQ